MLLAVIAADEQVVEQRLRLPVVEHADDAQRVAFDQYFLADAVGALEQFFIERAADDRHPRAALVLGTAPAVAVQEGCVEHREKIGRGVAHADAERFERIHLRVDDAAAAGHQRLPRGLLLPQQFLGVEAGQLPFRLLAGFVAFAHAGVELHVEQLVALVRDGVAGEHLEHGERGHRRADAQRNGQHHQCSEYLVAAKAAQRQFEVVGKHGSVLTRPRRRGVPAPARAAGRWLGRRRCARCAARVRPVPGRG